MGPRLFALRSDVARTTLFEHYDRLQQVRVRCALPGWLQRLELTVRVRSRERAYGLYRRALGHGIALCDTYCERPIVDGWITEIIHDGQEVTFIVGGAWHRHSDQYVTTKPGNEDTDAYLKNSVLTASNVPAISTDHSNIDATGTAAENAIKVDPIVGVYPQELVERVLKAGTSNDLPLDYWLQSAPMDGVLPQAPLPYLKERTVTADADWQVERRDLVDLTLSRQIWNLRNAVTLFFEWYTLLSGSHSASDTTLSVDHIANFAVGQEIEIELDDDRTHRTYITATSVGQLTIAEGLSHSAPDDGIVAKVKPIQATAEAADSDSQSSYWEREHHLVEEDLRGSNFDLTQVHQLRDTILAQMKDPVQDASFTIGSRTVRDGAGARWPLWRMLQAPGFVRINDLLPEASLLSTSQDGKRVFWTAALDYDHNGRRLSVTPDAYLGERRLDVILQRLGIGVGQGVRV